MRWLSILVLFALTWAIQPAFAKPSVAIAPIEGDDDDKVGNAIADALADDADTKGPTATGKAMSKLGLSGELTVKDKKALFKKLAVDVLVEGKLAKDGKKKKLALEVTPKGEKSQKFSVEFKSATSDSFKSDIRDGMTKYLGGGEVAEKQDKNDKKDRDKDKDDDKKDRDKDKDDDKKADRDRDKDDDDDKKRRDKDKDDDEVAEADGGEVTKKKKKRRDGDDDDDDDDDDSDDAEDGEAPARHMVTQRAVRVNAGAGFVRRSLSYAGSGTNVPPRVGTAAASVRFEAELYPLAFDKLGGAAGLGLYGNFDKSLGLGIAVPGGGGTAAIDQSHYALGARYRLAFAKHSLAFGAAFAKRKYVVDRGGPGAMLDVPDVNYTAIAPGAVFRIGAGPKIGVFLGADALLMLDAGPIADKTMYGSGSIIAFEADGGVDIALGKSYALRLAVEFAQITIKFNGKGAMAGRMVTAAQDRNIGGAATFAITY